MTDGEKKSGGDGEGSSTLQLAKTNRQSREVQQHTVPTHPPVPTRPHHIRQEDGNDRAGGSPIRDETQTTLPSHKKRIYGIRKRRSFFFAVRKWTKLSCGVYAAATKKCTVRGGTVNSLGFRVAQRTGKKNKIESQFSFLLCTLFSPLSSPLLSRQPTAKRTPRAIVQTTAHRTWVKQPTT